MKSSTSVIVKQADHILQILVVIFYCMYNDGVSKELLDAPDKEGIHHSCFVMHEVILLAQQKVSMALISSHETENSTVY